jgi:hypothetical protein
MMTVYPLQLFKNLFVNRSDCYCIQLQTGGYTKINEALTDAILQDHLDGKVTVGAYQLDQNSLVKSFCFDIDPEKHVDPKTIAKAILNILRAEIVDQYGKHVQRIPDAAIILEASRYGDNSYHVWVLFNEPIKAAVARWMAQQLLSFSEIPASTIEIFPKQDMLTPERPYGNFVKLPFGKHQVEQKYSRLLDLDSFEPQPLASLEAKAGLTFSEADLAEIERIASRANIQTRFQSAPASIKALDASGKQQVAEFLAKYWRNGYRNELTLSFCGYCIKNGYNQETASDVIREICKQTGTSSFDTSEFLSKVDYQFANRKTIGNLKGISGIYEVIRAIKQKTGDNSEATLPL